MLDCLDLFISIYNGKLMLYLDLIDCMLMIFLHLLCKLLSNMEITQCSSASWSLLTLVDNYRKHHTHLPIINVIVVFYWVPQGYLQQSMLLIIAFWTTVTLTSAVFLLYSSDVQSFFLVQGLSLIATTCKSTSVKVKREREDIF